jgi:hypothetical protein
MSGRAWSLLAVSGRRQYAGNVGYADDPVRVHRYDSNVGNSRHVANGDLAVVRDTSGLIGIGIISRIEEKAGTKQLARCPVCSTTAIKQRAARSPAYRCSQGHEFDQPRAEMIPVQHYEAHYGSTWISLAATMDNSILRTVTIGEGRQNSIQEIDVAGFVDRITGIRPETQVLLASFLQAWSPSTVDAQNDGYVPSFADGRVKIVRAISERRGQSKFRNGLIGRYGARCMISSCDLLAVVEAAHIWPYRGEKDNELSNGLLLRSDLHTLYDLDLIGIEPETLEIHGAAVLKGTQYAELVGRTLNCSGAKPNSDALSRRWNSFQQKLLGLSMTAVDVRSELVQ